MVEIPITVLMLVHDAERCLLSALDSVFRQTWADCELLVVTAAWPPGAAAPPLTHRRAERPPRSARVS